MVWMSVSSHVDDVLNPCMGSDTRSFGKHILQHATNSSIPFRACAINTRIDGSA